MTSEGRLCKLLFQPCIFRKLSSIGRLKFFPGLDLLDTRSPEARKRTVVRTNFEIVSIVLPLACQPTL